MAIGHNMKDPVRNIEFKKGDVALHGDVFLIREDIENFEALTPLKTNILMTGETSHAHAIVADAEKYSLREDVKTKVKYLRVVEPVALRHEEHREILIPPGDYRIGVQREYSPWDKLTRQVAD